MKNYPLLNLTGIGYPTLFGQWGTLFSLTHTLTSPEGIAMLSNTHIWEKINPKYIPIKCCAPTGPLCALVRDRCP